MSSHIYAIATVISKDPPYLLFWIKTWVSLVTETLTRWRGRDDCVICTGFYISLFTRLLDWVLQKTITPLPWCFTCGRLMTSLCWLEELENKINLELLCVVESCRNSTVCPCSWYQNLLNIKPQYSCTDRSKSAAAPPSSIV